MSKLVEKLVLSNMVLNEGYCRKVFPFIQKSYFEKPEHEVSFDLVKSYLDKYNTLPTKKALLIDLANNDELKSRLSDQMLEVVVQTVSSLYQSNKEENDGLSEKWLLDKTEEWCKDRAISNAVIEAVTILDGNDKENRSRHVLPSLLENALAVSFDQNVGHSYIDNFQERFDFYHRKEEKLPFDLEMLNKITDGGIAKKTLNAILASTGVGKTSIKCHFAASYLMQSKNVLYLTMEMAEERIAERIDANLMNVPITHLKSLKQQTFKSSIDSIRAKTTGNLYIKQFPTAAAHVGHFRALLNELKQKKDFSPDVIFIDYLNICASSRIKQMGGSINSYSYIKSIAEEVRGLAIEQDCIIWTSTQSNRAAATATDMGIDNISESFGTAHTLDLLLGAVVTEEMRENGQIMFKQLKNRYGDLNYFNKFFLGVDFSKMKLYDLEDSSTDNNSGQTSSSASSIPTTSAAPPPSDFSGFEI